MKKIAYLIVREDLNAPLVQSQCVEVISSANHSWRDGRIELVWFYRIDYIFRKKTPSFSDMRRQLLQLGIKVHFIPFVSAGFPVRWWALPFVLPQWLIGLLYLRFYLGFRLFHCRSYHAGLIARFGKCFLGICYVFDPRSPFPEENISAKRWGPRSLSFRLWKRIESWIINEASKTIIVSHFLFELYQGVSSTARFSVVPNNYPVSFGLDNTDKTANKARDYTLVYVGSFGNWNKPEPYLRLLKSLNRLHVETVNMLFIVRTESVVNLLAKSEQIGLPHSLFDVVSVNQHEVPRYLEKCLIGVYLMDEEDPRLGVKTVEYLAMGLPVIVSDNIKGAADLIRAEELGVIWDHSDSSSKRVASWISEAHNKQDWWRLRCKSYAREHLSCQSVAGQLIAVYRELDAR